MRKSSLLLIGLTLLGVCAGGCGSSETPAPSGGNKLRPLSAADLRVQPAAPKASMADPFPVVMLRTADHGDILVKLNSAKAPLTVQNFLEYVARKHYDGTIFHYVYDGYVIRGGAFKPDLREKETSERTLRNEARNGLKNKRGTIAMFRDPGVIDGAKCEFIFNLADNTLLDHKPSQGVEVPAPEDYGYCVFGEVADEESMKTLERIAKEEVEERGEKFQRMPKRVVRIQEATVLPQ